MKKEITITMKDHQFVCTPDPIILQRQTKDWIEWTNNTEIDCWICFASTPFDEADYLIKGHGGKAETNSVQRDAHATNFKYDVVEDAKVQAGTAWHGFASEYAPTVFQAPAEMAADPQVIVH